MDLFFACLGLVSVLIAYGIVNSNRASSSISVLALDELRALLKKENFGESSEIDLNLMSTPWSWKKSIYTQHLPELASLIVQMNLQVSSTHSGIKLGLQFNNLGGEALSQFFSEIRGTSCLTHIFFEGNSIDDASFKSLVENIVSGELKRRLKVLHADFNSITDDSIKTVELLLKSCPDLEALDLFWNDFSRSGKQKLSEISSKYGNKIYVYYPGM